MADTKEVLGTSLLSRQVAETKGSPLEPAQETSSCAVAPLPFSEWTLRPPVPWLALLAADG